MANTEKIREILSNSNYFNGINCDFEKCFADDMILDEMERIILSSERLCYLIMFEKEQEMLGNGEKPDEMNVIYEMEDLIESIECEDFDLLDSDEIRKRHEILQNMVHGMFSFEDRYYYCDDSLGYLSIENLTRHGDVEEFVHDYRNKVEGMIRNCETSDHYDRELRELTNEAIRLVDELEPYV